MCYYIVSKLWVIYVENDSISNKKFIFIAISVITFSSFFAFLIGYGLNSGTCPVCKDKKIIKVFTTANNVVNEVDYNMTTSEIKRDLIGKYINQIDDKSYLEIDKDGNFVFLKNSCGIYKKYTNEDYVLLLYYSKVEIDGEYEYENILTLIPKGEIETSTLTDSIITFKDSSKSNDGISNTFVGPITCSTSNIYVREE